VSLTMGTWSMVRKILSLGRGIDLGRWSLVPSSLTQGQGLCFRPRVPVA
jgi:hypothetical protein